MTDLSNFIANGGVIKRVKPRRARGNDCYRGIPQAKIKTITRKPETTPSHFSMKEPEAYHGS